MISAIEWPDVPAEMRPKKLFVDMSIEPQELAEFGTKGWFIVDVRLLPNLTDADRAESVKATLEGVRVGSIKCDPRKLKYFELEARVYGLHNTKQASDKVKHKAIEEDVDVTKLFSDFNSGAFKGTWGQKG